jgi:hypothetical protein
MVRVPIERPRQYGTRILMSVEEQRELEKRENERIDRVARSGFGGALGEPGHWVEWGRSQLQTSLLVDPPDGRMPPLTEHGNVMLETLTKGATGFADLHGPEDFTPWERCISRGVIGSTLPSPYGAGIDITQAPGVVAIRYELIHETRVIPLDGRRRASSLPQYMGDARGNWSGDTLVVETRNLSDKVGIGPNGNGPPPSPAMRLTERFTRVGPGTIRYEVTVEDPQTFTAPFTLAFPLTQKPEYAMLEFACHEGNLGLRNALSGSRSDEAKGMGR